MSNDPTAAPQPPAPAAPGVEALYQGIRQLLEQIRAQVVLQGERAAYSAGMLKAQAEHLTRDYGGGFSHSGRTRIARFFDSRPGEQKVATLSHQSGWSHFFELLKIDHPGLGDVEASRRQCSR